MDFAWRRTERAWVELVQSNGTYTVWTAYRSTHGAKLERVKKGGYVTRDEAEKDLLRFRHCVETEKAWKTKWVPISVRRGTPESTTDLFSTFLRENACNDKNCWRKGPCRILLGQVSPGDGRGGHRVWLGQA